MLEKEKLKEESKKEYQKDLNDIQNIMDKIRNQDLENLKEDQRKKDITRQYMENAYAEKAEKKRREKEEERLKKEEEERIRKEEEERLKREEEERIRKEEEEKRKR